MFIAETLAEINFPYSRLKGSDNKVFRGIVQLSFEMSEPLQLDDVAKLEL